MDIDILSMFFVMVFIEFKKMTQNYSFINTLPFEI